MSESGPVEKLIACCGLICTECPAYIATKANDEAKIAEIAANWAKEYNIEVATDKVWCDGCTEDGRKCGHCYECEIRACAMAAKKENCGMCDELETCTKIGHFMSLAPQVKSVLDKIAISRRK